MQNSILYIKLFSFFNQSKTDVLYVTVFKYGLFFAQFQCNDTALKITTNYSDNVHFACILIHLKSTINVNACILFHLKFTINVNIVHIPVEATFSMSIVCHNHYGRIFTIGISRCLLCPDFDPS